MYTHYYANKFASDLDVFIISTHNPSVTVTQNKESAWLQEGTYDTLTAMKILKLLRFYRDHKTFSFNKQRKVQTEISFLLTLLLVYLKKNQFWTVYEILFVIFFLI